MYSIFISVVLLFKFQSLIAQDLTPDKDSLKSSLIHVDKFLKQVGQRIDTERSFLQSVGRRNAPTPKTISTRRKSVTVDGVSNEDYANLWFGGNKFDDNPKSTTNRQKDADKRLNKDFSNFYKAIATFDEEELKKGTTIKLVNAVHDLKGLVESDVDVKSNENSTKFDTLRKIQVELKNKDKLIPIGRSDTKKSKRDNDDDFDVFGSMEFPEDSNLPVGITPKSTAATGGGTPPEVLDENFIIRHEDMPGPRPEIMSTPSTTTDDNEPLLNPKDFGYTTSHKPLPTYGDVIAPPEIDQKYFTTTPPPDDFVASLKADMEKFHMGVFSIAMLKIFHMVIWKNQAEGRRIAFGLGKTMQQLSAFHKFDDFGELAKNAINSVANTMATMPYDEMRSEVVMLHNALLHRRELFSNDVNSLIDHIDSLYTRQETTALLESLERLDEYNDAKDIPYTISEKILNNFLSPWRRIKDTPRGSILKEAINRAIKNHFYVNDKRYPDARRSFTINIPVKLVRSVRPTDVTAARSVPNLRNNNIQVFKINTRRDDLNKNIYNTDLQTLFNNFMQKRYEQARKSQVINSKPLFNKQLKNNLNINNKAVDNKQKNNVVKPGMLRMNLNTKVTSKPNNNRIMIITNNNQEKSNVVDKPRSRSGDSYVDFNMVNINDSLVQGANHFELEMYPDVPMVVSESPNELNFQIEGDKLNFQVDGDKKLIVIDKKDAAGDQFRENVDLHMASSSTSLKKRKHHKKHHKKHKRTHEHINLKEKLARIKKIIKMYRSGRKGSKHRRHHRHNKEKEDVKSLSIKLENVPSPAANMNRNLILNAPKINPESDRRFQIKDSLATVTPFDFTTQVYAVKSNFINLRRQMMDVDRVKFGKTEESDEEIALRKNLYKAMNIGGRFSSSRNARRAIKRKFSRELIETDDEAVLKNKIYSYFNNIEPA